MYSKITNILLIEDNNDIINWVRKIAEKYNINIIVARNTSEYALKTKGKFFPVILCDINLDYEKEGFDIVKIQRKTKRKSKLVAFTSENFQLSELNLIGFDCKLAKNFDDLDKFLQKLSKKI